MVERLPVEEDVAGSNPVSHPYKQKGLKYRQKKASLVKIICYYSNKEAFC